MDEGADPNAAAAIQSALVANFSFDFRAGQKVRVGLAPDPETGSIRPVRVSLYEPSDRHIATVALSDNGLYVAAQEPVSDGELAVAEQEAAADLPGTLPTPPRRAVGHGPVARHEPGRDQEPRPHLLLRRGLPDAAFGERQSRGDLLDRERQRPRRERGLGNSLRGADASGDVTHRFYRFRDSTDGTRRLLRRGGEERAEIPGAQARGERPLLLRLRHAPASDRAPLPHAHRRRLGRPVGHADHGGRQRRRSRRSARAPATAAPSRCSTCTATRPPTTT